MGLDTSHECWHGAYSAFMRWRQEIAHVAGMPPLGLMEGFYQAGSPLHDPLWALKGLAEEKVSLNEIQRSLPIKWEALKPSPIHILLNHSDCDGEIRWQDCGPIADALDAILPKLPQESGGGHIGDWREKTEAFIKGLRLAAEKKENVIFH